MERAPRKAVRGFNPCQGEQVIHDGGTGLGRAAADGVDPNSDDCLARASLSELAGRYPGEVSGGEARRAALARALAPRRDILLLDEPLANLQPELCAGMARWITSHKIIYSQS